MLILTSFPCGYLSKASWRQARLCVYFLFLDQYRNLNCIGHPCVKGSSHAWTKQVLQILEGVNRVHFELRTKTFALFLNNFRASIFYRFFVSIFCYNRLKFVENNDPKASDLFTSLKFLISLVFIKLQKQKTFKRLVLKKWFQQSVRQFHQFYSLECKIDLLETLKLEQDVN